MSKALATEDYASIRSVVAELAQPDVSTDAVGAYAPSPDAIYAPATHANALDKDAPIVVGARGVGKSFWAGVLGQDDTRVQAHKAYPKLGLDSLFVQFGFTGIGGAQGVGREELDATVPSDARPEDARAFWWATVIAAIDRGITKGRGLSSYLSEATTFQKRQEILRTQDAALSHSEKTLLIVYDALDMVATDWPRRRLLTEALLEVVWGLRAYRCIRPKVFVRPDQLEDDALKFVELPKLRTGAVRLRWSEVDLYGLLFARLATTPDDSAQAAYEKLLRNCNQSLPSQADIVTRRWPLLSDEKQQKSLMSRFAGEFMAEGRFGYKKGNTYNWTLTHLADAFGEVTPRSFLGLMMAAATHSPEPSGRVVSADGLRHGLRAASKTRVDQLHQEFPWIKAVLAPLAGLLLPQDQGEVFAVWRKARTADFVSADSAKHGYLPPFDGHPKHAESELFAAMERIGVMFRRGDDRLDMPDLFRVAAKLLKKGATAPL